MDDLFSPLPLTLSLPIAQQCIYLQVGGHGSRAPLQRHGRGTDTIPAILHLPSPTDTIPAILHQPSPTDTIPTNSATLYSQVGGHGSRAPLRIYGRGADSISAIFLFPFPTDSILVIAQLLPDSLHEKWWWPSKLLLLLLFHVCLARSFLSILR